MKLLQKLDMRTMIFHPMTTTAMMRIMTMGEKILMLMIDRAEN